MGSVWKRLNRINKRASRYKFTASYQELYLEAGPTWQPHSLSVVWTRRGRRVVADPVQWEPTMKSPYIGMCVWPVPDVKEIMVTLYRDQRQEEYDNKDWFFVLEDVKDGKRKPVAQGRLNLKDYAKSVPHQEGLKIKLRPLNKKVSSCFLTFTLSSQLLKEGKATDDDMKSIASLMSNSTIPNNDIADLDALIEDDEGEAEKVEVATSELAALTESIKNMNQKLENLAPAVLPVRTVLSKHQEDQVSSEPQLDPDPPPAPGPSQCPPPSSSTVSPPLLTSSLPPLQPAQHTSLPPALSSSTAKFSCSEPGSSSNDKTPLLQEECSLPAITEPHKPVPPVPSRPVPSSTGETTTPRKVPATPPRRRHSRNASMSSPFVLPPTPSSKPPPPPSLQAERLPSTSVKQSSAPSDPANQSISDRVARSELIGLPSSSQTTDEEMTRVLDTSLTIDKSNGTIVETLDLVQEVSTANESVVSQTSYSVVTEEEDKNNSKTDPEQEEDLLKDVDIRIVDESKRVEKLQKSKSQELREFTQEFVLSTVVDFDPMTFENTPKTKTKPRTEEGSVQKRQSSDKKSGQNGSDKVGDSGVKKEINSEPKFTPVRLEFEEERRSVSPASNGGSVSSNGHSDFSGSESHTKFNSERRGLVSSETSPNLSYLASSGHPAVITSTPSTISSLVGGSDSSRTVHQRSGGSGTSGIGASSDLLDWAKTNLVSYSNVKVTNFTTSWRNGLAFCALIHSFYPDLIKFQDLNSHDIKLNNKVAFEAGEILGIPRVLEPENMAIRKIPDKLAVITYLHQLRSSLGTEETNGIYEAFKENGSRHGSGMAIRKSFSEGNIKLFTRQTTIETDKLQQDLPTVEEEESVGDPSPNSNNNVSKYRQKAKELMEAARAESKDSPEKETDLGASPTSVETVTTVTTTTVVRRQKSLTPKSKDSRLSYIDNEMRVLDEETQEIDRQAAILDRRIRETPEDDELVYDALLQQWFTLVNKKNTLIRRQMQLNILEKEDDLEKKKMMLQDELRMLSDMSDSKKTEEDRQREELLLQELVMVVNQRNDLVMQGEYEERMMETDEQIEQDVTLPEDRLVQNRVKEHMFSAFSNFFRH